MAHPTERPPQTRPHKRRRLQGACDICKHKKIRCDSATMPDNRCSNCMAFNSECTHNGARKRVAPYNPPYTTHTTSKPFLESHLGPTHFLPELGKQVNPLCEIHPLVQSMLSSAPSLDFDTQCSFLALSQHILNLEREISNLKQTQPNGNTPTNTSRRRSASPEAVKDIKPDDSGRSSAFSDEVDLSTQLKRLTIHSCHSRHFGASSTFSLLGTALKIGKETQDKGRIPDDNNRFGRPQFWNVHPWEACPEEEYMMYEFPDRDLLHDLVGLYFDQL
ncbi:hypothetical protein D9615_004588 [Tricholomella constricta]|uniref:Zn(2)-C6 fungal-type domain-containing protein n=1 Tax=Tricholomella constricta TaxID=117010 RepID=A0A8H5HCD6_9AGAR|nr:hypothetical protein D9615_004588 [Tricholomella constricta]